MKFTNEERREIICTIMDKEDVSKDFFDMVDTLKAVAELEVRALQEQAELDGWQADLLMLKKHAEHKVHIYTEVLELIQYDER